ncbi:Tigger transposable element-derived protein 6 [Phytophthora citrophthora]|uniref:Tigger transposable element-derived protein 6 n=1 Tax=Phytophthora citrophthora TaxID=4793 RepID=A0AAD9GV71_9STRA|nr:Tigger transposable element-derived protein 6 [Phytophthora citrophthora]
MVLPTMRDVMHTNAEQLRAVDTVADGNTAVAVALESKCHLITLYRWAKRRDEIADSMQTSTVLLPGRRGPKVTFPGLETSLLKWVAEMRKEKVCAITSQCLLLMSVRLEPSFLEGRSERAAVEYLRRFRVRNNLSIRRITHKGRRKRSELHAMLHNLEVSGILASVSNGNKLDHFFYMDQTSIYIDMNPKTIITFHGERDVDAIQEFLSRKCFPMCICQRCQLPAFIVCAGAEGGSVHCELQKNELHKNGKVVLTAQKNAYCDQRIMLEWIQEVWLPSVTYCRLLLLDSLKIHKMASVRAELEKAMTSVEFVPAGVTGLAQPMDVSVMRVFKHNCRELYVRHHMTHDFSANATARRSLITAIVAEAWEAVSPDTIRRGFIKAGLVPIGPRTSSGEFAITQPPPPHLAEA